MSDVTLLTSIVQTRDDKDGFSYVNLSGEPHAAAIVNAVAGNYHRFSGRPRVDQQTLEEMIGQKVTLVLGGENMLGSGMMIAREGKLFQGSQGVAILPKGRIRRARRCAPWPCSGATRLASVSNPNGRHSPTIPTKGEHERYARREILGEG